ncbi:MAG: flagellar biosynthetic protein FliO [Sedimenticola sp.]|nr:flagellar biosynthetic protein FliO [Sedimenticola sp.]
MRRLLLFIPLQLPVFSALAQEEKAPVGPLSASPLGSGAVLETAGGLLLILLLILGLGWLLRRFGRLPGAGKGGVSVIGGVSLGPRERAVLIEVGATRLLVGVAPGRVQTLHVLEDDGETSAGERFAGQLESEMREGRQ